MEKEKPKNTDLHAFLKRIDRILGLSMVGFAIFCTVVGALWFISAETAIPFSFAGFVALMFFIGVLLIISDWLENHLNIMDEIDAFPHVMSYHLAELRQGHITHPIYICIPKVATQ